MKSNLVKATSILTIATLIYAASGYLTNIWLGRHLGPTNYGIYGLVISVMAIINLIQTAGLPQAVAKLISANPNDTESILKSGLQLQIISTIILTIIYYFNAKNIALLLNDEELIPFLKLSALIYPSYAFFAFYSGYYNGLHNFSKQAIINIIYSLTKAVTVISLAFFFGVPGALIGFILSPLAAFCTSIKLPKRKSNYFAMKKLIYFSLPMIGFSFFISILQSEDLFFIKSLLSQNNLAGYYIAAQNIAAVPSLALSSISSVLFPNISRSLGASDIEKTRLMISSSLRYILIILIPATFFISATSSTLLTFLYSDRYLPGATSLSILIFSWFFIAVYVILANILNGAGHPKESFSFSVLGVVVSAICCRALIPQYGLNGAAIATGIGGITASFFASLSVYRKFLVLVPLIDILKIFFSVIPIYLLILKLSIPIILLPLLYLLSYLIYFGILYLIKGLNYADFELIAVFLPNKLRFHNHE